MTFTPIMFARHSQAQAADENVLKPNRDTVIMDFSGTEAIPFLSKVLGLDINKLSAVGFGLRSSLDEDLSSSYAYAVYYFSETAFRFVVEADAAVQLQALINEQQLRFDIDYVVRDDLSTLTLSGEQAFDALIESFKLTPGLRLSNHLSCYGAQSGDVFITALDNQAKQQFQLVAKSAVLQKWQSHLQQLGFDLLLPQVA